jgi:hypothetical protein
MLVTVSIYQYVFLQLGCIATLKANLNLGNFTLDRISVNCIEEYENSEGDKCKGPAFDVIREILSDSDQLSGGIIKSCYIEIFIKVLSLWSKHCNLEYDKKNNNVKPPKQKTLIKKIIDAALVITRGKKDSNTIKENYFNILEEDEADFIIKDNCLEKFMHIFKKLKGK